MSKVVGLGACVLDTLINCDKYPTEDTKQRAQSIFLSGGGPVGNALLVASRLGINAEFIGALGGDNAGSYLIDDFNKYGVKTENVTVLKDKTSFTSYVLLAEEKASRTCVFDRGSVPDDTQNVKLCAIDDATVLHLDGNYLNCAIHSAKYAREKGIKVSLDAGGLYEGIDKLLPYVDILIPSAEFALGITGEKDIPRAMQTLYSKYKPEILVVTDGSNGGYYWKDGKATHYDSFKVKAIDTNGAGDTFHGAFVTAYCKGKSIEQCCMFASAVAGYKCKHKGIRSYKFDEDAIAEFVKEYK